MGYPRRPPPGRARQAREVEMNRIDEHDAFAGLEELPGFRADFQTA
jgi:hypothetical protein